MRLSNSWILCSSGCRTWSAEKAPRVLCPRHCPVCVQASRTQTRKKQRPGIDASAVQGPLEEIEKLCLTLPPG